MCEKNLTLPRTLFVLDELEVVFREKLVLATLRLVRSWSRSPSGAQACCG
jgi:hypothetical protein